MITMKGIKRNMVDSKKFVLINGPSRVGKDTLAKHLASELLLDHRKLSRPLTAATEAMFSISPTYAASAKDLFQTSIADIGRIIIASLSQIWDVMRSLNHLLEHTGQIISW